MKEVIGILVIGILVGCGSENSTSSQNIEEVKMEEAIVEGSGIDKTLMEKGKAIYVQCLACHQANGEGITGAFPPLANSDYMLADINRMIKTILNGTTDPIMVNGTEYPGNTMTKFTHLSDKDIAAVATYVLNSWGNPGGVVTTEMVASNR
jgi:mono/diheme cytochrome c family protein|tara:strand:- start:140 stop:592 length:453 start_codon:yes stop_codon:yes gene_type:complete